MSKITLTELEKSEVYGLEFTNPDTGNKIKVASGLTYPKETKAYQQAMSIVNRYLGKQKRNVIQPTPDDAKPEGSSDRPIIWVISFNFVICLDEFDCMCSYAFK